MQCCVHRLGRWAGPAFAAAVLSCLLDGSGGGGGGASAGGGGADLVGQGALVASSFIFGLLRVRTQLQLKHHAPGVLNLSRMVCMGALAFVPLLVDVAAGGASRATMSRVGHITST